MQTIPILELSLVFIPTIFLLAVMFRWKLKAFTGLYANIRMVLQLFLVGYFLTYVFETKEPVVIIFLVVIMIGVSAWIAFRSFEEKDVKSYFNFLISIGLPGLILLGLVTQFVLQMQKWFEPSLVVPIAGMIFANSMNTVSLAAERFESEIKRDKDYFNARRVALEASLIPQINTLFIQEMSKRGVHSPTSFKATLAHSDEDIAITAEAAAESMKTIMRALEGELETLLEAEVKREPFRRLVN